MKRFDFFPRICLVAVAAFAFAACSNTVGTIDDEDESSSSAKAKSSSSVKSNSSSSSSKDAEEEPSSSASVDDVNENCVGEAGNPWDGTTAKEFACGTGTKLDPYVILTGEQLAHLSFVIGAKNSDYMGKYYKLGADIRLNDGEIIDENGALVADSAKLYKWTPIGNSSVAFDGYFDGNGHSVGGMFINTTSTHNGLFGSVSGEIKNVTVDDSWVTGGKYTAGIVGLNVGTASGLLNKASVTGTGECVGGVIGQSSQKRYQYNSIVKNAQNRGIVTGKNNVGGIVGCATYVTMDSLENYAEINGFGYVAGVVAGFGNTSKNEMRYAKNYGKINGSHFVGGVVGACGGTHSISEYNNTSSYSCGASYTCGTLTYMYNEGNVTGKNYVGGVVGESCSATITDVGNVADVEGDYGVAGVIGSAALCTTTSLYNVGSVVGGNYVGGIFSYNEEGVTSSAYNVGKVTGDSLVGLMIGYNYNATMADYYYLEQGEQEPFGKNDGGGVATPKSASEIKSEEFAKLLGDDFIYDDGVNDGWPALKWERE